MNLRKIAKRLQTALCYRGRHIRINQIQYYSEKTERIGTIYQVCETVFDEKKEKNRREVYCESTRMADVVEVLSALYEGGE